MSENKFEFARKLDTTELIKGTLALVGAVIVFCTVTTAMRDVEIKKVQLSLAQELPKLIPNFRNNYTNQISKDGRRIEVLAVLRNQSEFSAYLRHPRLQILDKKDEVVADAVQESDIMQLNGLLSPNSEYRVRYDIKLKDSFDLNGHKIIIVYKVDMPEALKTVYRDLYAKIPDADWSSVKKAWSVKYIYKEQLYAYGSNPIWKDWWENPR